MASAVQSTGFSYLWSYSGGLNILEEVLNIAVIVLLAVAGFSTSAKLLLAVVITSGIYTAILIILHIKGIIRRSKLPWHWIECISVLIIAILLAIFSSAVMSVWTKMYIITGVIGFCTSMVYFMDTFDKYKIAVAPVQKYAWTTPNMPDLN